MDKFTLLDAIAVPLDRANVDTDAIIPKQFLKSIHRSGFGDNLFDEWRYADHGEPGMDNSKRPLREDFVLNKSRYKGAQVLVARENFGCGSSREHAPWALQQYGFRAVIATSFADIFFNNCYKNGLLPIVLKPGEIDALISGITATEGYRVIVDLEHQAVRLPDGRSFGFAVDGFRKHCMLNGLDEIGLSLRHADKIRAYEQARRVEQPWLFG
jgi:3-isopropylmalate/(R)-2-methylmalate dehydratase small subunit